ncbi:hypothetical protein M409DRAFT_60264 [Zasmidium cellare ATCC 36951]|uniref:Uncharacterized protein n=1 Tax=Zasmidium cellare ATCC 36951 TaxID=1080233 RepID=A0A6A6BZE8_ZASCE|nr:uncharacterized protein M409DRAFT_60264 [Zasmidium cellare ATCC 36951]KAF2160161.1 hypothetical protein M409DRAFT_60264 [Zasmidium cellare ATCC 36951]
MCHKQENYGLIAPLDEHLLEQKLLPQKEGTPWTNSSLRKELKAIGVECPSCLRPRTRPPLPFKRDSTVGYFEEKTDDGFPKRKAPMKTVGQMLKGMMSFLETVVTSELALRELRKQLNDETPVDMDQLQDLEPDDEFRLHALSKTLKYHTDALMRDQDDMCRDEATNKKLVEENDIVLMESSFDVTESYATKFGKSIEPHSGICESSRAVQKTNKYRPYKIEDVGKETFTAKAMSTFGDNTLRKVAKENHKQYMLIEAVDEGVEVPTTPGKMVVQRGVNGFLHAQAETRRYDEPMMAFEGKFPLRSKIISSCYSDILAHQVHMTRMSKWLADGLPQDVLDGYQQDARAMYTRNTQGLQIVDDVFKYSMEHLGEEIEGDEEKETKEEDDAPHVDDEYNLKIGDDHKDCASAQTFTSPSSDSSRVLAEHEKGSNADSVVGFASIKSRSSEQQILSPALAHFCALASVEDSQHVTLDVQQRYTQDDGQNLGKSSDQEGPPRKRLKIDHDDVHSSSMHSNGSNDEGNLNPSRCDEAQLLDDFTAAVDSSSNAVQATSTRSQLMPPSAVARFTPAANQPRSQLGSFRETDATRRAYRDSASALASHAARALAPYSLSMTTLFWFVVNLFRSIPDLPDSSPKDSDLPVASASSQPSAAPQAVNERPSTSRGQARERRGHFANAEIRRNAPPTDGGDSVTPSITRFKLPPYDDAQKFLAFLHRAVELWAQRETLEDEIRVLDQDVPHFLSLLEYRSAELKRVTTKPEDPRLKEIVWGLEEEVKELENALEGDTGLLSQFERVKASRQLIKVNQNLLFKKIFRSSQYFVDQSQGTGMIGNIQVDDKFCCALWDTSEGKSSNES